MTRLGAQVIVVIFLLSVILFNVPVSSAWTDVAAPLLSGQDGAYQSHGHITIHGNDDLASQGWNGTGTAEDPFLIENLNITSDSNPCISIYGTSLHLVIRNCVLYSAKSDAIALSNVSSCTVENCTVAEISVSECIDCSIISNDFQGYGLGLSSSRNISVIYNKMGSPLCISGDSEEDWQHTIVNNTLNGGPIGYLWGQSSGSVRISDYGFIQLIIANSTGFSVYDGQFSSSSFLIAYCSSLDAENISFDHSLLHIVGSETSTIEDCVLSGNSTLGLYTSTGCIVRRCVFDQSLLALHDSEAIQIRSNIFQHRGADLLFSYSSHCVVSDNEFVSSGISFYGSQIEHWTHNFSNNTVDSKPLGYFKQVSHLSINTSEYGALVLADCHGLNVSGGVFQDTSLGIQMGFCTDCVVSSVDCIDNYECGVRVMLSPSCMLKDSVFTANNYGIDIGSVSGTTNDVVVTSCTVTNNTFGIFVTYAKGVKILESTVSNNKQNGISLYYSSDAYIENSTINMNAGDGISCYWVADNCTFIGNNITANLHDGIQFLDFNSTAARNHIVGNGRYGILVSGSNSLVYGNWIVANNDTGIEVLYSSNSTISSNVICNNTAYGLHIEGSNTDVKSSDNTIYDNLIGWNKAENALDDGSHNMWDNGTLGNAWSDYTGYGTYSVPGSAGSIDRFPRRLEVFPVTSNTNMDEFQPTALFLPLLASAGIGAALVVFLWYRRSSLEHAARVETALH